MNGRTIGAAVVILAIGAGALLLGVFDSDESFDDPSLGSRRGDSSEAGGDSGRGHDAVSPGAATTDRFDSSKETPVDVVKRGVKSANGGYRLTGRVVTEASAPVPGARVDLIEDNGSMAGVHQMGSVVDSADADGDGKFSFEGVEPGVRMILRATHEDFTMGRAYGIDAARPATLHQVIRVEGGYGLRGKVVHQDGRPLEGVRVAAYDLNLQAFEPEDQLERAVVTGVDGSFEIRGLAKGMKRLLASQAGLASKSIPAYQIPAKDDLVEFKLEDGFVLEGRVVEEGSSVGVPKARVMVRPSGSRSHGAGRRVESVIADETGRFTLIGLRSGACEVWARGDTHLQSTPQVLQAGATNVTISLRRAARIEGRVVDAETNQPIERYTLLVTGNEDYIIPTKMYRRRIKDQDGAFVFDGLRAMKLWLAVRADGYAETLDGPYQVSEGQLITDVEIRVGKGATARGRVIDQDGSPVGGAKITMSRKSQALAGPQAALIGPLLDNHAPRVEGMANAAGVYEISGLRPGTWTIRGEHSEYATDVEVIVNIENVGVAEAPDLRLRQAGGVRGIVKTEEGKPDGKARLTITSMHDPLKKYTVATKPNGTFEKLGVAAGDYKIIVIQRDGVVDIGGLLGGMARGKAPKVYSITAGQILEVEL